MTEFGATSGTLDLTNDVEPVTTLKRSAAELIARATDRYSPIVITQNGRPTAVLQDLHSYERQQRALHLLKLLAQGDQDQRSGRTLDSATVDGIVRVMFAVRDSDVVIRTVLDGRRDLAELLVARALSTRDGHDRSRDPRDAEGAPEDAPSHPHPGSGSAPASQGGSRRRRAFTRTTGRPVHCRTIDPCTRRLPAYGPATRHIQPATRRRR